MTGCRTDPYHLFWSWPYVPVAPAVPRRRITLPAEYRTSLPLRASSLLVKPLQAEYATTFVLRGRLSMSATGEATIYRGDAPTFDFRVDGLPSLAGWNMSFKIWSASGTLIYSKVPANDTPARGHASASLTRSETTAMPAGVYSYELHRYDPGAEATMATGVLTVRQSLAP